MPSRMFPCLDGARVDGRGAQVGIVLATPSMLGDHCHLIRR